MNKSEVYIYLKERNIRFEITEHKLAELIREHGNKVKRTKI